MLAFKEFFSDIGFCIKISWDTSKTYTTARICVQIISALLPLVTIYFTKLIFDTLVSNSPDVMSRFVLLLVTYVALQLSFNLCQRIGNYYQQIHDNMLENFLNQFIIKKSSGIDIKYFDQPAYYDKIKLMRTNSAAITKSIWDIVNLVSNIAIFIAAFTILLDYSLFYSLIIVGSYIPIAFCEQIYIKKIYNWQVKNISEERKLQYIADILTQKTHAKEIRVFSIASYFISIYSSIWTAWFSNRKVIVKKWSLISLFLYCIPQIITALFLVNLGFNIITRQNSIGDFSLYSGMITQLLGSMFLMIYSIVQISDSKLKIRDYREYQNWQNTVEDTEGIELISLDTIEFDQVSFTYPGNKEATIKNFSIRISSKERIALVGINGAGKSTLIKLLLRFYDASEGRVLINGIDIRKFTPQSIRKFFSTMFQEYSNYAFTLRENIRLSNIRKQYEDLQIIDVCKRSGVDEMIDGWEKGLDTYLYRLFEEDGRELSGGENQKVALARTFFRDGDILIMDEPSSSLDPESEYKLFRKMVELGEGKGIIMITQRLSNVDIADRIIVIENGELLEQGSHTELINKKGRYAELYRLQADTYVEGISKLQN